MKSTKIIDEFEVVFETNRNVWKIMRCDIDPTRVGEIVSYGMPYPAKTLPVGSTYKTEFDEPV